MQWGLTNKDRDDFRSRFNPMFKKPVIVAVAINIKGIGCGGWLDDGVGPCYVPVVSAFFSQEIVLSGVSASLSLPKSLAQGSLCSRSVYVPPTSRGIAIHGFIPSTLVTLAAVSEVPDVTG